MTTKYRVHIAKVLEDGTEVTITNVVDEPWYVSPILKQWAKKIHLPIPPPNFKGQGELIPKSKAA